MSGHEAVFASGHHMKWTRPMSCSTMTIAYGTISQCGISLLSL